MKTAEIVVLKDAVLEIGPENYDKRLHALIIYNFIEKCENLVVNPEERVYNELQVGELKII